MTGLADAIAVRQATPTVAKREALAQATKTEPHDVACQDPSDDEEQQTGAIAQESSTPALLLGISPASKQPDNSGFTLLLVDQVRTELDLHYKSQLAATHGAQYSKELQVNIQLANMSDKMDTLTAMVA